MTLSRRAALLFAALLAVGCDAPVPSKPAFKSIDITGATYAQQLSLPDVDGRPRSLAEFKGKATVVFFGFTQCPDVCPSTMAELSEVKRTLGPDGERLQGVFISVDPERDTPEVLKSYVQHFDPSFVALRGTPEQTRETAKEFKVFFSKVPGETPGSYTIDHTAGSFVFDPQGRVRLFARYGSPPQDLVHDLKILLREK